MGPHPAPTKSYWTRSPIPLASASPGPFKEPPVVIIGSGITAASTAYALLPLLPTVRLLVLDSRSACDGATGRNGGHCKVVPHEELAKLTPRFGAKRAAALVRFQMRHVECLSEICELVDGQAGERTEFREVETVDLFVDGALFEEARAKVEAMKAVMPDVEVKVWAADSARKHFKVNSSCHGAISYKAAALYPYRLVMSLWSHLLRKYPSRLTILPNTPATSISTTSGGSLLVRTPKGDYPARHVIHATNAYAPHLVPSLWDCIVPVRAHMTSQRPGPVFPGSKARSWSVIYHGAFDYVTQRPGNNGSGDLLIGGGWSRSAARGADAIGVDDDSGVERHTVRYLEGVFPRLFEPYWGRGGGLDMAWSGIIGVTPDGLPLVGKLDARVAPEVPTMKEPAAEWIAAGYNGEGMVFAFLCGAALAAHVAGREGEKMPVRPGIPSGRVAEWFPSELYVSRERLRGKVSRDVDGLFSCSSSS